MSKIGAWAAEAEREEAEEREAAEVAAAAAASVPTAESQSFPSVREGVSTKPKKKKMTLSEFNMGTYSSSGGGGFGGGASVTEYNRLTTEEMRYLPTRPKERSAEEMQHGRLGGGFSSFARSGPPAGRVMRDRDDSDGYRQNRYGELGTGGGGGISRADGVDNWMAGKRSIPARSSTFGSGFRDSGPEPDRWTRSGGGGGFREERPRLVLDPPRGEVNEPVVKANKPNPFGVARPREEVLAEKGLDWKKLDSEIEAKKVTSRPTSAHSSRPSSAQSSRSEGPQQEGIENVVKPKPKVNPFGDAKPREVLLEERGQDWRKIDLELERRRMDRPETEEENILKEEIDNLKKVLETDSTPNSEYAGDQSTLRDTLLHKERELEILIRDLENKVRFGQKAVERPGSGAGRIGSFPDRPPSESGSIDGSRSVEFMDGPRSGGTAAAWTRPGDDRRGFQGGFQGGRDKGFLGNRDMDRSRSRERW